MTQSSPTSTLNRRNLLKGAGALGAGLVIGFPLAPKGVFAQAGPPIPKNFPPAGYVRIAPDDSITVISKHTEMGQGIYTGLATMLADEMDADWSKVRVVSAPVNLELYAHFMLPGMQGTGGSMSTPNSWLQYRTVGATARAMLITAAANQWQVPVSEITVDNGVISHRASKRSGTLGQFAEAAAKLPPPTDVPLKTADKFKLIGKELPKVDSYSKATGKAQYTIDVRRPDMVVAMVERSPRFGGKLKAFDASAARKLKGVVDVFEIPEGVVVLANNTHVARKAREVLQTEWDDSAAEIRGDQEIIADYMRMTAKPGATFEKKGFSADAKNSAAKVIEADYVFPYLAHACMEPLDCTMELKNGECTIRSGTQMPSVERDRVAEILGLAADKVHVENLFAGGGFGRRANFVPELEAMTAHIVKATDGRYPIRLQLSREDDTMAGYFRPLFVHRLRGALDGKGNITAWENSLVGQSFVKGTFLDAMVQNGIDPIAIEGSAFLPYEVPNVYVDYHMAQTGIPTLSWRSVGNTHTGYSKETFIDELLEAGGKDPITGRLALMHDERAKKVVSEAAERANWGKQLPSGRAQGFAYVESFNTRVAEVAEVSLDAGGQPRVHKVTVAVDCGIAINPNIIRAQVESAIAMGLTAALFGEVKIEKGIIQTKNFDTYRILRMNQMPAIDVHIVKSEESPTGIGEPGLPPIAPAVANALYKLTGKRIYRLPFDKVV